MSNYELLEKSIDEQYREVKMGESLGQHRRIAAYLLKIVAAGGGLVVATQIFENSDRLVGIAIVVAVFIDTTFSNHLRLIAETKASYAFKTLARKVKTKYHSQRDELANLAAKGNQEAVNQSYQLLKEIHRELADGIQQIHDSLADVDIKALTALGLDDHRKGQQ